MPTTFNVISLGTFADLDPIEGDQDAENDAALAGLTFGSSIDPLRAHVQELSPIDFSGGVSDVYDLDNNISNDTFSIDGGAAQTHDSTTIYNATITYIDGSTATITVVLFQDTDGNLYLAPEVSANSDNTALNLMPLQSVTIGSSIIGSSSGSPGFELTANRQAGDFVVCFAFGTKIETDRGQRLIEELAEGDLVKTMDHGLQPIRWIGSRTFDAIDLAANPKLRPIHIKAGALGENMPASDLSVSPQHRMLMRGKIVQRMFGADAVLVPAVKLLDHGLAGVERDDTCAEVEYFHILFDEHEIIFANGAPCESLYTGAQAIKSLSPAARKEIKTLFPEICVDGYSPTPARMIVQRNADVAQLLTRHQKNQKPLLA